MDQPTIAECVCLNKDSYTYSIFLNTHVGNVILVQGRYPQPHSRLSVYDFLFDFNRNCVYLLPFSSLIFSIHTRILAFKNTHVINAFHFGVSVPSNLGSNNRAEPAVARPVCACPGRRWRRSPRRCGRRAAVRRRRPTSPSPRRRRTDRDGRAPLAC